MLNPQARNTATAQHFTTRLFQAPQWGPWWELSSRCPTRPGVSAVRHLCGRNWQTRLAPGCGSPQRGVSRGVSRGKAGGMRMWSSKRSPSDPISDLGSKAKVVMIFHQAKVAEAEPPPWNRPINWTCTPSSLHAIHPRPGYLTFFLVELETWNNCSNKTVHMSPKISSSLTIIPFFPSTNPLLGANLCFDQWPKARSSLASPWFCRYFPSDGRWYVAPAAVAWANAPGSLSWNHGAKWLVEIWWNTVKYGDGPKPMKSMNYHNLGWLASIYNLFWHPPKCAKWYI